jgi:hypothetical protein
LIARVTIRGVFRNARTTRTLSPDEVLFSEGDAGDREFLFLVHETPTFALDVMRSLSKLIHDLSPDT